MRIDGQPDDLATARGARDMALLVRERRDVEDLRDALSLLDLDEQHLAAARREGDRQRRGDGRLAGAALAAHDVQTGTAPVARAPGPGPGLGPLSRGGHVRRQ